jgi:hypothetical protein
MKTKTPLWPTIIINIFERSCGTFKKGGGNNSPLLMTLG